MRQRRLFLVTMVSVLLAFLGAGALLAANRGVLNHDPVIAAAGDIACDPSTTSPDDAVDRAVLQKGSSCRMKATSDLLVSMRPTAVLALGDLQYHEGTLAAFQQSYAPTWGRVKAITHPAVGNHEYSTRAAVGYYRYFGAAAGDPTKGYYSYDIGAWHLIVLNSNCEQVGGCQAGSPQEQWLRADLAAHPTACTLAYWHHPRFSSGPHGSDPAYDAFWQGLYQGGAEIVLNGHDHDYERFAPQDPYGRADPAHGLREFVVGTGGRSHYRFTTVLPHSEVRNDDTFGVLTLTLHADSYDWRFIPEADKTFTDLGRGACHGRPALPQVGSTLTFRPVAAAYVDSSASQRSFSARPYLSVDADARDAEGLPQVPGKRLARHHHLSEAQGLRADAPPADTAAPAGAQSSRYVSRAGRSPPSPTGAALHVMGPSCRCSGRCTPASGTPSRTRSDDSAQVPWR